MKNKLTVNKRREEGAHLFCTISALLIVPYQQCVLYDVVSVTMGAIVFKDINEVLVVFTSEITD